MSRLVREEGQLGYQVPWKDEKMLQLHVAKHVVCIDKRQNIVNR